ncbi:hypothetical protein NDU88_000673 [Pleurodeles waltl]|uniref:Uncharacterized protein n=1 Tax=Pleurodeles waltl TaxID=8319 RepID=A0AAV7LVB4_PLEWA|nr:hypothetical protein NDU88_000673 [Pleurodeles waltl]
MCAESILYCPRVVMTKVEERQIALIGTASIARRKSHAKSRPGSCEEYALDDAAEVDAGCGTVAADDVDAECDMTVQVIYDYAAGDLAAVDRYCGTVAAADGDAECDMMVQLTVQAMTLPVAMMLLLPNVTGDDVVGAASGGGAVTAASVPVGVSIAIEGGEVAKYCFILVLQVRMLQEMLLLL